MLMVFGCVECLSLVARGAECVVLRIDFATVRIVTIGAGNARLIHFTLNERAVNEHLVSNLAVWEIQIAV